MTVAAPAGSFTGFRPEAIQFLADLAANNDRAWFTPRKAEYEELLKRPLEAFVAALDERFKARDIPLKADPARSPFRIYRDVRFAKDKSPYKTNVGASFPWVEQRATDGLDAEGRHGPGGYFHVAPGEVFVGGGMWHPERSKLTAFRDSIVRDPSAFRAILDEPKLKATFGEVRGEPLSRVPQGYPKDHPEAELLKLTGAVVMRRLSDEDIQRADLPDRVADTLGVAVPFFRYLAALDG